MQFKFYDEVDPEQVNDIMLISHGEPADMKTMQRIRRLDPFASPWLRMYALEGDRIAAQVGVAYPEIETTEGKMKVGFVEAVAAMPSFARQGYAKSLMKKVHEQMVDDGIELFVLGTSRTLVAYSMYPKLGYKNVMPFNWAMKKGQTFPKNPITLKVRRHKADEQHNLFRKLARGNLGFIHRPEDYPKSKCAWAPMYSNAVSLYRDDKPVGYALVNSMSRFLVVRELVCPDLGDYVPCLQALENRFGKKYVSRSSIGRKKIASQFTAHGFVEKDSWGTFMAMDPDGKLSQQELRRLLGIDQDRFQFFVLDTY